MNRRLLLTASALVLWPVGALDINYGNKGADGVFAPTGESVVVDLSLATPGSWDAATPENDHGIYDAEKWAVVFKFSAVNIPTGTTVTFKNHPSRAPVVWLVEGEVAIAGTVDLSGQGGDRDPDRIRLSEPGPGGFRGGDKSVAGADMTAGLGPGGGWGQKDFVGHQSPSYRTLGTSSGAAAPTYGNSRLVPLIGGSGSGGLETPRNLFDGAGGGGALCLVSSSRIALHGVIKANGGPADSIGGSGGAIRLVCESAMGDGRLETLGAYPNAGHGRARIECQNYQANWAILPPHFPVPPSSPVHLWPEDNAPKVHLVSVGDSAAPPDPRANLEVGQPADMIITSGAVIKFVTIATANLPTNAIVTLRIVSTPNGGDVRVNADFLSTTSDPTKLLWQKEVTFSPGYHALQVVAVSP